MTLYAAFLRGINLGKRQMKMAELKVCLEGAGYAAVKTVLASGNVRFEAEGSPETIRKDMEQRIREAFGFEVGVVLRTGEELQEIKDSDPFGGLDPKADLTRHVLLFDEPLPEDVALESLPGHTEIVRIDRREIYIAAYRQPNGRYTEHVEAVLKPLYARLGKGVLDTMRNWNTIEKILT